MSEFSEIADVLWFSEIADVLRPYAPYFKTFDDAKKFVKSQMRTGESETVVEGVAHSLWQRMRKPPCYNRPPFVGAWFRNGYKNGKVVLRWFPHVMSQPCKSWDGPGIPDPVRYRWKCFGCAWFPEGVRGSN